MMRVRLKTAFGPVEVIVGGRSESEVSEIVYEGAPAAVAIIRRELVRFIGEDGRHLIAHATPADLRAAMRAPELQRYGPEEIE